MLNTFGYACSMEPLEGTDSANIPEPPKMEGFGSEDVMRSPFNYGSVEDGMLADSLEKKLRNQYWKAKQSVIEKLGKSQDEFVVAGDADIDTKLERAYHLGASCRELLQALDKYCQRLKEVTHYELLMGEHLRVWSETEYTNAGEVMQNVGKLQEEDAKARLGLITPLMRLHQESFTFRESAIRDLANSIHLLEKARSEYRAALLWMKDVSMKLQNPDYHNQLAKFRESQAAVKNTRHRFERLKSDLSEKIIMVSASRCNLLSRLLPIYQKELLTFTDKWAGEYHKIMADLRSHHHHQYKLKNIMEEIRDLELQEAAAFELPPPDIGTGTPSTGQLVDNDEPLIDVGGYSSPPDQQQPKQQKQQGSKPSFEDSLLTIEQEARVNDLQLSGIAAGLQEPSDQYGAQEQPPHPPSDNTPTAPDQGDLLQLSPQHQASSDMQSSPSDGQNQTDQLFDEWSSFSAFMPATKSSAEESGLSDWEKEFMQDTPSSSQDPFLGLDPLGSSSTTGLEKEGEGATQSALELLESTLNAPPDPSGGAPALSSDSTLDELLGMGGEKQPQLKEPTDKGDLMTLSQQQPVTSTTAPSLLDSPPIQGAGEREAAMSSGLESLDLAYFQEKPPPSSLQNPPLQQSGQPLLLPTTQQMQTLPITGGPMFYSPLTTSQGPIFPPQLPRGGQMASGSGAQPIPKRGTKGKEEGEKKGTSWMNVFAHLDPLVNEKV